MNRSVWPKKNVQDVLRNTPYSIYNVDISKNSKLAWRWAVRSVPTIIIVELRNDKVYRELDRYTGFMDANELSNWLNTKR